MDVEAEITKLSRRVEALEAEAPRQQRFNARVWEKLTEISDDMATLRKYAVGQGQQIEAIEARLGRVEVALDNLRRDMPSIVADAMREVLKEKR
jgi:chromosome segregation ATPase